MITIVQEEAELQLNKLVFSVTQYGNYQPEQVWGMDVIKFFHTLALLNEKAKAESKAAEQAAINRKHGGKH